MANNNDFIIENDTGQQVREDIQNALQQLASNNFGNTPPVTTDPTPVQVAFPHQWFANGDTGKLMYKDATNGNDANTNYFNLANLTGGLFVDQTSTFNGDVIFNPENTGIHGIVFDASHNNGKGKLQFKGDSRITVGTNDELQIVSIPGASTFASSTKALLFSGDGAGLSGMAILMKTVRGDGSGLLDDAYRGYTDGRQELYFDGSAKFKTSADGIEVIGNILPTTDNDKPLGSSSKRFSTLHSGALNTGDINMSNLNDNGNEVDGSKGSWSIQEGSNDLFLINRVNGKKYKFNLIEVN